MRFLCFHGAGTNAKVFEGQTARLRQALGPHHEFVFINGTVKCKPAPGTESVVGGSFRFVGKDLDLPQLQAFLSGLANFIKQRGPFDGVMGFSEGGAVAAGLLALGARQSFAHFKCGIFLCAATPIDAQIILTGEGGGLDLCSHDVVIHIPTAHIWSAGGEVHPDMGRSVAHLFEKATREDYVHDLGHAVPGSMSNAHVQGTVRAIERTIERAKCLE